MRSDSPEGRVQEFLDGRMTEEERVAFEARLERDVDLARRVEAWREIRSALRDDDPPLSPGFYTRARARFEESRRGRRWFRLLSWETAGLTAAVAIAAVLFVPQLLEQQRPGVELLDESSAAPTEGTAGSATMPTATGPPEKGSGGVSARADKGAAMTAEVDEADSASPGRGSGIAEAKEKKRAPTPAAPEGGVDAGDREETGATHEREADGFAPVPGHAPVEEESAPPPAEKNERREAYRSPAGPRIEPSPESERARPDGSKRASAAGEAAVDPRTRAQFGVAADAAEPQAPRVAVFELPRGTVGAGETRTVRSRDDRARLDRLGGGRLAAAGGLESGTRVVLVGPRTGPIACSGTTAVAQGDLWVIRLGPAGASPAAAWGCGVVLPDDGRPVTVVGPEGDEYE